MATAVCEIHSFHPPDPISIIASTDPDATIDENIKQNGIRFKRADSDTPDINDSVPIPATKETYSWHKTIALYVKSGLTDFSAPTITNVRVSFPDPPPTVDPTDVTGWVGQCNLYVAVTGHRTTDATVADETTQFIGTMKVDDDDGTSTIDANHPLDGLGGLPGLTFNDTYGAFIVLQMGVLKTCQSGVKSPRQIRFLYDEA